MKAVKFWATASHDEKEKSGNPPDSLPKDIIHFEDSDLIQRFIESGYSVMSDDDFANLMNQLEGDIAAYHQSGYRSIVERDAIFALNDDRAKQGRDFLLRFKLKNISEGVTWPQALWLHQRVKSWHVQTPIGSFEVDLMNIILSGDLEAAIICLRHGLPDDMTSPFHWVTQERIDWCISELIKILRQ